MATVRLATATMRIDFAEGEVHLQEHARGHEARTDHADPDRGLAVGDVFREGGIDEDQGGLLFYGLAGAGASAGAGAAAGSAAGTTVVARWSPRRSASCTMV